MSQEKGRDENFLTNKPVLMATRFAIAQGVLLLTFIASALFYIVKEVMFGDEGALIYIVFSPIILLIIGYLSYGLYLLVKSAMNISKGSCLGIRTGAIAAVWLLIPELLFEFYFVYFLYADFNYSYVNLSGLEYFWLFLNSCSLLLNVVFIFLLLNINRSKS